MQTVAAGLTELTEDELKKLLRHIYREELPCPVTADTLACVGFQSRHEWISAALRGLDAAGVTAVLVAVIAERRKAAEDTGPALPDRRRDPAVVNVEEVQWEEAAPGLKTKALSQATGGRGLSAALYWLDAGERTGPMTPSGEAACTVLEGNPILSMAGHFHSLHPGDYVTIVPGGDIELISPGEAESRFMITEIDPAGNT
ncbi:MAG: quercetin dioxygenase-like cupin family protein [Myxococcota bacterium]|jgi:quercetin dioxygenase-like cupin family protein